MLYADDGISFLNLRFENDVKVDGTQTEKNRLRSKNRFENDVKVDGTQTKYRIIITQPPFENDVKVDGTQTEAVRYTTINGLRMM